MAQQQIVVNNDTLAIAIFKVSTPPPVNCFEAEISRQCTSNCKATRVYQTGNIINGQCERINEEVSDSNCCAACTTDFIRCDGTLGVYYTGLRDPITFECLTVSVIDDPQCVTPTYTVTLVADPPQGGTALGVSQDGELTSTPSAVVNTKVGKTTSFTATRNSGYTFVGWYLNGQLWSSANAASIIVNYDITMVAKFQGTPPPTAAPTPPPTPAPPTPPPITPSPTPAPPTQTPAPIVPPTPPPTQPPVVPPTPPPTAAPTPAPVEPPKWRSCIDGLMKDGYPPSSYIAATYQGAGGGICWEPAGQVGFEPDLATVLTYFYQRGSSEYPQPKTITAVNPSYALSYQITMETNSKVTVTPKVFTLQPRGSRQVVINVTPELLADLGDGVSTLDLNIEIKKV